MAEYEKNTEEILNYVDKWCKRGRLVVNNHKTKVVHFRNCRTQRSTAFPLGKPTAHPRT